MRRIVCTEKYEKVVKISFELYRRVCLLFEIHRFMHILSNIVNCMKIKMKKIFILRQLMTVAN